MKSGAPSEFENEPQPVTYPWSRGDLVKRWFTSDTHFGHTNVIGLCSRPFANIEEHDEELIRRWNSVVSPEDEVYHLGDFCLRSRREATNILRRLNGHVHLIIGNHDKRIADGFVSTAHAKSIRVRGQRLLLSHRPFATWSRREWQLHGHSHGNYSANAIQLDVGVDCHDYKPIDFDRVTELLRMRKYVSKDHHE